MSKLKKALERAKEARGDSSQSVISESNDRSLRMNREAIPRKDTFKGLQFSYSKTRVVDIDPHKLKENKIFSHIKKKWDGRTD